MVFGAVTGLGVSVAYRCGLKCRRSWTAYTSSCVCGSHVDSSSVPGVNSVVTFFRDLVNTL